MRERAIFKPLRRQTADAAQRRGRIHRPLPPRLANCRLARSARIPVFGRARGAQTYDSQTAAAADDQFDRTVVQ
eukprot:7659923-Lingulodinium_polyedra.AAC.1